MCHWSDNEIGSVFPPLMVREPHHERAGSLRERRTVRLATTPLPAHPEALEGRAERQPPAMVVGSGQGTGDSGQPEEGSGKKEGERGPKEEQG